MCLKSNRIVENSTGVAAQNSQGAGQHVAKPRNTVWDVMGFAVLWDIRNLLNGQGKEITIKQKITPTAMVKASEGDIIR